MTNAAGSRLSVIISGLIDHVSSLAGRLASFFVLATIVICGCVALLRHILGIGFLWMQELYVASSAVAVLLAAAEAYRLDQHVRVDVLSQRLSQKWRRAIEVAGVLFLLVPWLLVILYAALASEHSFVRAAIAQREGASFEGGLPGVFIVKAMIVVWAVLLLLQGCAVLLRRGGQHRAAP